VAPICAEKLILTSDDLTGRTFYTTGRTVTPRAEKQATGMAQC